jgi:hypothetical protein
MARGDPGGADRRRSDHASPEELRGPPGRRRGHSVPFDVGDVLRVYDEDGNEALVLVVGHMEAGAVRDPVVAALEWERGATPEREAVSPLRILPDP